MKKYRLIVFSIVIISLNVFAQQNDIAKLSGSYLGQKTPGIIPEIFAPGIVSSKEFVESNCLVWDNGNQIMFYRINVGILESNNLNGRWDLLRVSKVLKEPELLQCISPDGKTLYYKNFHRLQNGSMSTGIFCKHYLNGMWSKGEELGVYGMWPSVGNSGYIYYTIRVNGFSCIARSFIKDKIDTEPEILSFPNEGKIEFMHPCVAHDDSFVIMDAENSPHENGCELYISFKNNESTWTKPVNMGDFIPLENAAMARLSSDGKYIFFQAEGDIYWVSTKIIEELHR